VTLSSGTSTVTDTANFTFDRTNFRARIQNATTADDNTTNMFQVSGTLPTTPSATVYGITNTITSAGSAAQIQGSLFSSLAAGYTGSSRTFGAVVTNSAAGTGATLNLSSGTATDGNYGIQGAANAVTAGTTIGTYGIASNSTGRNISIYGKAPGAQAGSNIGVLGNASGSTEATDLINVGVLGSTDTALPAANVSAGVIAAAEAGGFPMRAYYDDTEVMRIDDSATATHTYLMIYDVDNATLERVTVDANDSCGGGFKCLRIPN
jgi:hypothetical protein